MEDFETIDRVNKRYKMGDHTIVALDDISFSIKEGEYTNCHRNME